MISRPARWILTVAAFAGAACTDPIEGNDTARGDYDLVSVETEQLPAVLSDDGATKVEVTSGTAQLRADGSCNVRRELRTTTGGEATTGADAQACTWTRTGKAIFLTLDAGGVYPGTWDEDALTLEFLIQGKNHLFAR